MYKRVQLSVSVEPAKVLELILKFIANICQPRVHTFIPRIFFLNQWRWNLFFFKTNLGIPDVKKEKENNEARNKKLVEFF